MLPSFAYVRPTTLKAAVAALAAPGARAHAGGTDLLGCLRDRVFPADTLVSLAGLPELAGVAPTAEGGLRLGAMTTVAAIAAHPDVAARYRGLAEAAAAVASPQTRNQGTLGGNLCQRPRCWYFRGDFHCARKGGETCFAVDGENRYHCVFGGETCFIVHPSDTAPALVALDALVRLVGPGGSRVVPLEKFFVPPSADFTRETVLEPGEVLTEVVVPAPPAGGRSTYRKVRARGAWDFALAGAAVVLGVEGGRVRHARVVLSGAAPIPWRVPAAEAALVGHRLDGATIPKAADAAVAGAEPLSDNAYKVPLLRGAVEEALATLAP
jgi:xanthine dehydrogenase YagS FAD-binding subunit